MLPDYAMKISVVIPTYNRKQSLHRCLCSFRAQTLPRDQWEVIVVNDGGEDVSETVAAFEKDFPVSCHHQPNQGPATARNNGARLAAGRFIAFTDDDCEPAPDWLEMIQKTAADRRLIGGKVINKFRQNPCSESSQVLIDFLYEHFSDTSDLFFTSNNLVVSKADFESIGGFDQSFGTSAGEDREFCVRARQSGLELAFCGDIRIHHLHFLSLRSFYRMHRKYGRAAYDYQRAIARQAVPATTRPRLHFYFSMLRYAFRQGRYSFREKLTYSLLMLLSQAAVAHGFFFRKLGE